MLNTLKKIFLLLIILHSFIANLYSQFTYIKQRRYFPALNDYQTSPFNGEYLLNYLVAKWQTNKIFYLLDKNNKYDTTYIDDLLPKFKLQIDALTYNNNLTPNITDSEDLKKSWFKNIYEKIEAVQKKEPKDIYKKDIKNISDLIASLPISKGSIWLSLEYEKQLIGIDRYQDLADSVCSKMEAESINIFDLYERGKAFSYIGDFAKSYEVNDDAIRLYYRARECIYNSDKDEKIKYFEQAEICKKTADIFAQRNLAQSLEKESNYYKSAIDYYNESENVNGSSLSSAAYLSILANLESDYDYFTTDSLSHEKRISILKNLEPFFFGNERITGHVAELDYLGYYSIATILRAENKNKAAIYFYIKALFSAIATKNEGYISASLDNISYTYALLANTKLSIGYSNLSIAFAGKLENKFQLYSSLIEKGINLYVLGDYASALTVVNNVQFDNKLTTDLLPFDYNDLLEKCYTIKFKLLDSLKLTNDSARIYERSSQQFQNNNLESFAYLINVESDVIANWLKNIKDREINITKELESIRRNNDSLLHRSDIQSLKRSRDSTSQEETIALLNDLLAKQIDKKRIADSTQHKIDLKKAEADKKNKIKQEEDKRKNERDQAEVTINWIIALSTLAIISILLLYQKRLHNTRIKRIEAERENALNGLKILSHQGKNHEFSSLAKEIAAIAILEKNELEKKSNYRTADINQAFNAVINAANVVSEYSRKYHESTGNIITTVNREIEMSRAYLNVFNMEQELQDVIAINNNITDDFILFKLPILSHFLHNFIMNSIKHGLKGGNIINLNIDINAYQTSIGYIIEIEDNGCGINYTMPINSKLETSTGLGWAKIYVEKYNNSNYEYRINLPSSSIFDKSERRLGNGTKVIIEFIRK